MGRSMRLSDTSTSDGNQQLLRAIKPITVPREERGGPFGHDYKVPQGKAVRCNDLNGVIFTKRRHGRGQVRDSL